jgi:hypothetical protein
MRVVFPALLAVSVAIAITGITLGVRARSGVDDVLEGSALAAAKGRGLRDHVPIERTIAPPVPVSPRFAAEVPAGATLSWHLDEGTDGARVELCPTDDFDPQRTVNLDVKGDHAQLPADWPSGVWYWRLRGRHRAYLGDRATPTWMLYVPGPGQASGAS